MINPSGVDQIAKKIAEQGLQEGASQPQQTDLQEQATHFQDAMQAQSEGVQAPQQIDVSSTDVKAQQVDAAVTEKVEQPKSLGDSILQGMDKMRSGMQNAVSQIENTPDKGLSPEEMLKARFQIGKLTATEEVTASAAAKANQDLDQLTKG